MNLLICCFQLYINMNTNQNSEDIKKLQGTSWNVATPHCQRTDALTSSYGKHQELALCS
jgi:hypothetical protein